MLVGSPVVARGGVRFSVSPGLFYTHGKYSDSRYSHDIGAYGTIGILDRHFLTLVYDNIFIEHDEFTFRQEMAVAALLLSHQPWAVKLDYGQIAGRFSLKSPVERLRDESQIYSVELLYWRPTFTLGVSASSIPVTIMIRDDDSQPSNSAGSARDAQQFTLRGEIVLHPQWRAILRPSYTWNKDGRRLYSTSAQLNYQPTPRLLGKISLLLGERAYYFDNDLLTIYNQNETQRDLFSAQAEYDLQKHVKLVGQYINTRFDGYSITYAVIGLKTRFGF